MPIYHQEGNRTTGPCYNHSLYLYMNDEVLVTTMYNLLFCCSSHVYFFQLSNLSNKPCFFYNTNLYCLFSRSSFTYKVFKTDISRRFVVFVFVISCTVQTQCTVLSHKSYSLNNYFAVSLSSTFLYCKQINLQKIFFKINFIILIFPRKMCVL